MPWKEFTTMEQKVEFICEWNSQKYSITELCRAFNISRPTAYKLIHRYEKLGLNGLRNDSKAPSNHPNKTEQIVVDKILKLKAKHKNWGAKKLQVLLLNDFTENQIPSITTVHNILLRNGLVRPQKRLRRIKPTYPIFDPQKCNEVWSADYKGKFKMGNMKYCHPLTIADSRSRYLFAAKAHLHEDLKSAMREFKRVFRMYGMPKQIHTDNGQPFAAATAIKRFSRLSYWFIELGILPVFSDPAHPEQNGRHERMHRDLKAYCAMPSAFNLKTQQRKLNAFVKEYNNVRPHEALDMLTPADVHKMSNKPFPERIKEWTYSPGMKVMYVTKSGAIRWNSYYWVYLTRALSGKMVAAIEIGNGIWKVYFRNVLLGYFNQKDITYKEQTTRLSPKIV